MYDDNSLHGPGRTIVVIIGIDMPEIKCSSENMHRILNKKKVGGFSDMNIDNAKNLSISVI